MHQGKARFVLLCQQGLACAVVTALLAPAAELVSLDIVATPPAGVLAPAPAPHHPTTAADPDGRPTG